MSKYTERGAQRFIQAKAGFVSVAALLCLNGPVEILAQSGPVLRQQPRVAQAPAEPAPGPADPAPKPAETPPAPKSVETPPTPPTDTPPASPTPPSQPAAEKKPEQTTPLRPVDVRPNRPRARTRRPAAPAAPQRVVTPPAPAAPAVPAGSATAQAQGPAGSYTPGYQSGSPGLSRVATPLLDTPQTVNVTQQGPPRTDHLDRQGRIA